MSSLSLAGRLAIAKIIFGSPVHLAWGIGDGAWADDGPTVTGEENGLVSELGRRVATQKSYVVPDSAGAIVLPEGSFTVSVTPTRHLYFRIDFDYAEATGAAIREVGLFINTVTLAGLPAGQKYFTPAQVSDPGQIIHLRNYVPFYRFPSNRERFEIVMTI